MSSSVVPISDVCNAIRIEDGIVLNTNILQHCKGGQSVKIDYQSVLLSSGRSFSVGDYVWWFPLQRGQPIRALGKLLNITRRISTSGRCRDTCVIQWLYNRDNLIAEFNYDLSQGELPNEHYIYTNFKCLADTKVDILDCQTTDVKIYQNFHLKYDQLISGCASLCSKDKLEEQDEQNDGSSNQKRKLVEEIGDKYDLPPLQKKRANDTSTVQQAAQGAELLRNRITSRYWRNHILPMIKECPVRQQSMYRNYFLQQLEQFVQPEFTKEQCDLLFQPVLLPCDYRLRAALAV